VFPHEIKFIAIFRDPTKRAKSHYEMVTSLDGTPEQIENRGKEWINMSIEEVIELDFKNMKASGLIPYWDNETKTIDMDMFRQFAGSKQEDEAYTKYMKDHIPMGSGSHSIVSRGMYELQLRQWIRSFSPNAFHCSSNLCNWDGCDIGFGSGAIGRSIRGCGLQYVKPSFLVEFRYAKTCLTAS